MVYKVVPVDKKSIDQDKYEFELPDGEVYKIRRAKYLPGTEAIALEGASQEGLYDLFGVRGTAAGDGVRALLLEEFRELLKDYMADSGLSVGGSQAS